MMSKRSTEKFVFYYFPTSFSSQKILFALYEKDVFFKKKLVSLFCGQHNEPWYVRLNPDGYHIPVLKHGEKIVVEPADIIDYISNVTKPAGGHPLVPGLDSELGRNVQEMRGKLDAIPMDILTYGIIYHPHLSNTGCLIPYALQRSMKENFANRLCLLTELAARHPDLRDAYLSKSQLAASNFDIITDADRVKTQLDELMPLFASIEDQLKKIKEEGSEISDELWLFGPMFTAADISLAILLSRLSLLGLAGRFFPASKFPCIHQYYYQVRKRPAFVKIRKEIANLKWTMAWENFKWVSPYIIGGVLVGSGVGAGYLIYKKLSDGCE
ncbi:ganglioside-induced differentiation-associated protein 1-like [Mya arenaria]|uniref:ganglioside-induced differentiation-associated protein 1-like n=1 Tax=Mya arenaria TaxID=6604 RepID=UPI0022E52ED8|nr:ganglioside-induced differentiation-associated protein 1-like [Mya arenaria]